VNQLDVLLLVLFLPFHLPRLLPRPLPRDLRLAGAIAGVLAAGAVGPAAAKVLLHEHLGAAGGGAAARLGAGLRRPLVVAALSAGSPIGSRARSCWAASTASRACSSPPPRGRRFMGFTLLLIERAAPASAVSR